MKKRRTADEVARLLREADHDLAKGLTVADVCRKLGVAEATYYRWRGQHDPAQVDARCELSFEVDQISGSKPHATVRGGPLVEPVRRTPCAERGLPEGRNTHLGDEDQVRRERG
jgi:hypothetical protein